MGDLSRNTEWSDTSVENIYSDHQHQLEYLNQLDELDISDFTEDNKVITFCLNNSMKIL